MASPLVKRLTRSFARTPSLQPEAAKAWPLTGLSIGEYPAGRTYIDLLSQLGPTHFDEVYRRQPWVYVAVNKIAIAAASLPFKSYGYDESRNRDRLPFDHPLSALIANPYPYGTTMELVSSVCRDVGRYDNALVAKGYEFPGGPVTELWPLDWKNVTIVPGETQPIQGFEYHTTSGRKKLFARSEVLHFQLRGGVSPLEPLSRTLVLEDAAQRQAISAYRNGMKASAYLTSKGRLLDEQKAEVKRLVAAYQGVDNAGGVPLFPDVVELHTLDAQSAKDAEWVAARKLNREEVAAAYGIDPTQIGILDRATFSNVEEAHRSFYMDTLRPWLSMIEDAMRVQLIQGDPAFADTFVEFDMADVLKGNVEQRFDAYSKALGGASWATLNEIRKLENLPPVDDRAADSLLIPLNMLIADGRLPSPEGSPVGSPALRAFERAFEIALAEENRKTG